MKHGRVDKKSVQSVEPEIADRGNTWLKSYNLDYKLEQAMLNSEIDKALHDYFSKSGGYGGNYPDAKLLLHDSKLEYYPILIEYKGYKNKLEKLDSSGHVENKTSKNQPHHKNINSYAVNGAIHYANALLQHTNYRKIIAIGMTGYKDEVGHLQHKIGVYYVSKDNYGVGQKVGEYTDFSFLAPKHFDAFIGDVKKLSMTQEELETIKKKREHQISASLNELNNDIYENEKGLGVDDRIYLVAAAIIATLGIPGKVAPLEKSDLKSSGEQRNTDGDILLRKVEAFLKEKPLPEAKRNLIIRTFQNTLTSENINRPENGESQLKRIFSKIVDDLGIYYKIGLTTDFTGQLFNKMYSWLGFSQDKLNDVVLTPSYIANFLVKLARIDKDSYVWDFATGSGGLLVAAMNEMLLDAKNTINSPEERAKKEAMIKSEQLLGIELLPSIYMLAILNMILMGDGGSNILNDDSLKNFDGKYGFSKPNDAFPATALILNPPYSAAGNGMVFVEKALGMMKHGYAAIIIQNSAGSGKAKEYARRILKRHTLLASIKMPINLFIGKSNVQTNIYVFRVNEAHNKDDIVKFIDFSNDGYRRTNRKKASINLHDKGNAKARYAEVVELVRFGKSKLKILSDQEYWEGNIDPENGTDWNQTPILESRPSINDFKKIVGDYLSWETSNLLKSQSGVCCDNKGVQIVSDLFWDRWRKFKVTDLFDVKNTGNVLSRDIHPGSGNIPYLCAKDGDNSVNSYISYDSKYLEKGNCIYIGGKTFVVTYQEHDFFSNDSHNLALYLKDSSYRTKPVHLFFVCCIRMSLKRKYSWNESISYKKIQNDYIFLPSKDGIPDYGFMENFMQEVIFEKIHTLESYLKSIINSYQSVDDNFCR